MELKQGDKVDVVDTAPGSSAVWPGEVTRVVGLAFVEVAYGGGTEQFRMPDGARGSRFLRLPKPLPLPLTEDDYVFLPEDQAVAPAKGIYFQRYADCWWAVRPGFGLVFYNPRRPRSGRRRHSYLGAPQCNADERVTRGVIGGLAPFEVEVKKIPLVWVQIDLNDYNH